MKAPTAFDWDDAKSSANLAKHGIPFAFAVRVFLDPAFVIEETIRDEDGEARHKAIGVSAAGCMPSSSRCAATSVG